MSTTLAALSADVSALAATAAAATVTIGRNGRGPGIVIGTDEILTSAHNLRDRTTQVTLPDGTEVQAELVASDAHGDLAVLRAPTGDAPALAIADHNSKRELRWAASHDMLTGLYNRAEFERKLEQLAFKVRLRPETLQDALTHAFVEARHSRHDGRPRFRHVGGKGLDTFGVIDLCADRHGEELSAGVFVGVRQGKE